MTLIDELHALAGKWRERENRHSKIDEYANGIAMGSKWAAGELATVLDAYDGSCRLGCSTCCKAEAHGCASECAKKTSRAAQSIHAAVPDVDAIIELALQYDAFNALAGDGARNCQKRVRDELIAMIKGDGK